MPKTAKIDVSERDLQAGIAAWLQTILELESISAMLVPMQLPMKNMVMPVLISDPQHLKDADPLAPAFAMNAAQLVCRLTRKPSGARIAAVLRPCEIRAFVELVKLHQGCREDLIIIGVDCLGAFGNRDYTAFAAHSGRLATRRFYEQVLAGKGSVVDGFDLTTACKACERPIPEGADILVGLLGTAENDGPWVWAGTKAGDDLMKALELAPCGAVPEGRKAAVDALVTERTAFRERMFADTARATENLEKLSTYLAACINCYNCRVACPVCYCRECVFVTDVFDHEPSRYLGWARRRGAIKMPTDTLFYHLTRMAHMSTACVGCGQCSNACPNDIPVMELFRTVAAGTQQAFDYIAGCDPQAAPPLTEFKENEFEEIVGLTGC